MSVISKISLDTIIKEKKLTVYFQPIVDNKQANIFAYEALIRGPINTPLYSPSLLFNEATKQG